MIASMLPKSKLASQLALATTYHSWSILHSPWSDGTVKTLNTLSNFLCYVRFLANDISYWYRHSLRPQCYWHTAPSLSSSCIIHRYHNPYHRHHYLSRHCCCTVSSLPQKSLSLTLQAHPSDLMRLSSEDCLRIPIPVLASWLVYSPNSACTQGFLLVF